MPGHVSPRAGGSCSPPSWPDEDDVSDQFYTISVCSRCDAGALGDALMARLRERAGGHGFAVRPVPCLAGCSRPLTVGFSAPGKASLLFGDIDPVKAVDALLEFGTLYNRLEDGWCNEADRPAGLHGRIIARIPKALFPPEGTQ